MRNIIFILFLAMIGPFCLAQKKQSEKVNAYQLVDRLMDKNNDSLISIEKICAYINSTFTKDNEKARAVFYWISKNIAYAPEMMYTSFLIQNRSELATETFTNKAGVCSGYATLFDTLARRSNLNSVIIGGSTRQDFLPAIVGHEWNAVKINDEWLLIDVTWGSGYLQNKKFIRKRNDGYFLTPPDKFINSHLPIDPAWQLLPVPITLAQFHTSTAPGKEPKWNFNDSISAYSELSETEQALTLILRLTKYGHGSDVTSNAYDNLNTKVYQKGINNYNMALTLYNEYIEFKNNKFTPAKNDDEILAMLPEVKLFIDKAKKVFVSASDILNKYFTADIKKQLIQIDDLEKHVEMESQFVDKYLSTKKNKRRDLFYTKTYSWFGIPIKTVN